MRSGAVFGVVLALIVVATPALAQERIDPFGANNGAAPRHSLAGERLRLTGVGILSNAVAVLGSTQLGNELFGASRTGVSLSPLPDFGQRALVLALPAIVDTALLSAFAEADGYRPAIGWTLFGSMIGRLALGAISPGGRPIGAVLGLVLVPLLEATVASGIDTSPSSVAAPGATYRAESDERVSALMQ